MSRTRMWSVPALLVAAQLLWWPGLALVRRDLPAPGELALGVAVAAVIVGALALRARAPLAASLIASAAALVGPLVLPGRTLIYPGDALLVLYVADLIALYGAGVRGSRRDTAVALAGAVLAQTVLLLVEEGLYAWTPVDIVLSASIYGLVAAAGRRRLRWLAEREAASRRLAQAQAAEREAAAAERRRLARELHDVTAHHLTSIVVNASAARMLGDARPDLRDEAVAFAARTGRETLSALRELVAVLPAAPAPEAVPSLADLVDDFRQLGQPITLDVAGEPATPREGEAAYGIVREALTNTLRYAPGAGVRIHIRYATPAGTLVAVADDGPYDPSHGGTVGSPSAAGGSSGGLSSAGAATDGAAAGGSSGGAGGGLGGGRGIGGMRDRAAALHGSLTAGPLPGGGWEVRATFPAATVPGPAAPASLIRRGLRSRVIFDAGLVLVLLALPLAGIVVAVEEEGLAAGQAALQTLVLLAHTLPLLWRRRAPWTVLAVVLLTSWLGPALVAGGADPGLGWILAYGAGAGPAAVYAVAAYGARPHLSWTATVAALLSESAAPAVLVLLSPPDADLPELEGPGAAAALLVFFVLVFRTLLAVPVLISWATGHTVRERRRRRAEREESEVAGVAAQAERQARDERARVAAGLRDAVLRPAAEVPRAAERADLDAVVASARAALTAMRGLLDGLSTRPTPVAPPTPGPAASEPSSEREVLS